MVEVETESIMHDIENGNFATTRDKYREIKSYSHKDMDKFLAQVCINGYLDGVKAAEEALTIEAKKSSENEVQMDFSDVLSVIGKVKGIGQKRLDEIEKACMKAFG
ncbi:MAG: hypothetical protein MJ193_00400 [Clostridia bacterium]|nr:hypothetical protein [Clostridia bacterium]